MGFVKQGQGQSGSSVVADPTQVATQIDGVPPYIFRTHPYAADEFVSRDILDTGNWEPFETSIVRRMLEVFDVFIDLGANIGWYSALAQHIMSPGGQVYAFEPDPRNFGLLRENVAERHPVRVTLVRAAISDSVGEAHLFHSPTNLGDHRLYDSTDGRTYIAVPMTTLDLYFGGRPQVPRLVKMDTQGSEPRIFRGAMKTFSPTDSDSAYIVEFWPHGMTNAGEDILAYIEHLARFPHVPFVIEGWNTRLRRTSYEELKQRLKSDLAPDTRNFADLVFLVPGTAAYLAVADLLVG